MSRQAPMITLPGPALNSGAAGLSLAIEALSAVGAEGVVRLDFGAVERMTASFANALVMTLLAELGEEALISRVALVSASDAVLAEWRRAIERYQRGIRLSTQRPGAA